jgi:hypothetical protein
MPSSRIIPIIPLEPCVPAFWKEKPQLSENIVRKMDVGSAKGSAKLRTHFLASLNDSVTLFESASFSIHDIDP